jgi:hypothetical protein
MRRMPSASVIVATAGRPSGTAAMASEMPTLSIDRKSLPRSQPASDDDRAQHQDDAQQRVPELRQLALERGLAAARLVDQRPDPADFGAHAGGRHEQEPRPSVGDGRAEVRHVLPVAERGARVAIGRRSSRPRATRPSARPRRPAAARSRGSVPSAGTREPASTRTMSPGTSSAAAISRSAPSRRRRAVGTACRCSAVSACSARHSVRSRPPRSGR